MAIQIPTQLSNTNAQISHALDEVMSIFQQRQRENFQTIQRLGNSSIVYSMNSVNLQRQLEIQEEKIKLSERAITELQQQIEEEIKNTDPLKKTLQFQKNEIQILKNQITTKEQQINLLQQQSPKLAVLQTQLAAEKRVLLIYLEQRDKDIAIAARQAKEEVELRVFRERRFEHLKESALRLQIKISGINAAKISAIGSLPFIGGSLAGPIGFSVGYAVYITKALNETIFEDQKTSAIRKELIAIKNEMIEIHRLLGKGPLSDDFFMTNGIT